MVYKRAQFKVLEQHRNVPFQNPPRHTFLARHTSDASTSPNPPCPEGGADYREKFQRIMVHTRLS